MQAKIDDDLHGGQRSSDHFRCGMNWIKGYYMILKEKNETF